MTDVTDVELMMATAVEAEIDVEAPVWAVFDQWARFEEFPKFMSAVESVIRIDDVRSRWAVSVAGRREDFYADIVDQVPDAHIAWQSTDGVLHAGAVTFTPAHGGTHIRFRMTWEPDGPLEAVGAALNLDQRQAERDLERFKEYIERAQHPPRRESSSAEIHRVIRGPGDNVVP